MSTTSPPTPPPSCTPQSLSTPAARADDSLGSTVTRPYCSSNNNSSSIKRSDGSNNSSQEKNKPPLRQEDANGDFNHGPRASSSSSSSSLSPSSQHSPSSSLIASTPPKTPQTSGTSSDADANDFFARNKLSKLDKLMCDDIAQSLLAAQGYERAAGDGGRYAWQGWCSYSVLLTQARKYSSGDDDDDGVRKSTAGKGRGEKGRVPTDVKAGAASNILLQFRPPHHAVDSKVLALARAVYGDELVPRLVYAADVLLWPRAVLPARELFFSAKGREGREEVMAMDRLCVMATTLLPGVPYAVVQPGRSGRRRRRGERGTGECGSGSRRSVVVLTREELEWQKELVKGFAGFVARGWTGCGGVAGGADADGVVHGFESDAASKQQVSVSSLIKTSSGGSSLCDRIPAKLAQLCIQLPTLALRERAEGMRKKYAEMGLDRCGGDAHPPILPLTLNHGDLVPGNILVDPPTGRLTGVVDWAEAEVGWWGLPLYGVEFLLGFVESRRRSPCSSKISGREENEVEDGVEDADDTTGNTAAGVAWGAEVKGGTSGTTRAFEWTYYAQAEELRGLFWEEVEREIGGVFGETGVRRAVEVVRDVGVLLWFGFAWDDGKVDRVVNEVDDPREVLLLETFLGVGAYGGIDREKAKL